MGDSSGSPGRRGATAALCGLLAGAMALTGCAGDDGGSAAARSTSQVLVADPGPFLQMCGGVSDEEFQEITGMAKPSSIRRNLVGCEYDNLGASEHGSFSWYRGSPIGREHTIVDTVGRTVREISIGGQDGYEGKTSGGELCEVGIAFGEDFFVWSLVQQPQAGSDACTSAERLAALTVERAQ